MYTRRILTTLTLLALALPAGASANTRQESLFQDDASLIYSTDQRRESTLNQVDGLGVDVIRSNVLWSQVAASPNSRKRPHGDRYATSGWARWDALVSGAQRRGIAVQLTLTGPLPLWASHCGGAARIRRTCRPDITEFGRFVAAAAKRYPTVRRWSVWNEPNQSGWLYPQLRRYHHRARPYAPFVYRQLAYKAIKVLRANGHKRDRILLGETAPLGRRYGSPGKRSMSPRDFIRGVLCIDSRGRRLRGWNARALHCHRKMPKLLATGWAHHPYTRGAGHSPRSIPRGAGDITLRTMARLTRVLHRGAHQRRIRSRLPVYLTEYGFQTNPPDRYSGVRPSKAAEWLNQSDWMAYRMGRVKAVAQYELYDERNGSGFQTGLRYRSGGAKPGLRAYRLPLWVVRSHGRTTIWGQVRSGGHSDRVEIRYQSKRHRKWRRYRTVRPNSRGFLRVRNHRRAYRWQLHWRDAEGHSRGWSRLARPRPH